MKNIINFYMSIFAPIGTIVILGEGRLLNANAFVALLFVYVFIYHPYISGLRLVANDKIKKTELWKNFIPGWNLKYFAFLFFDSSKGI